MNGGAARCNRLTAAGSGVLLSGLQRALHDPTAGTAVIRRGAIATPAGLTYLIVAVTGTQR